jgi:hypothetical protein
MSHPECNCHDCTQARYRMSFQYQLDKAMNPIQPPFEYSSGQATQNPNLKLTAWNKESQ